MLKKERQEEGMALQVIDFLQSVYSLLRYHRSIGVDTYPAGEDVSGFLGISENPVDDPVFPGEIAWPGQAVSTVESSLEPQRGTLRDIDDEIRSCTSCELHTRRLVPVPGHGGDKPRLLLIGGWLVGEEGGNLPAESTFGTEEDGMVARMLAAIRLPPEQTFVTNIIKCAVTETCQPSAENVQTCFSYLLRQIIMLDPEIICTMGIVASRALLKNSQPLSQLRGKFYQFVLSDQKSIPVLPTYHPTFLLQNPTFKRAAWEDLQSIAKQLKTM
jgi:uracil-DNA glycosylase